MRRMTFAVALLGCTRPTAPTAPEPSPPAALARPPTIDPALQPNANPEPEEPSKPDDAPPPVSSFVAKAEEFARRTCACTTVECTNVIAREQTDWITRNFEAAGTLSDEEADLVSAATTRMANCISNIAIAEAEKQSSRRPRGRK